MTPKQYRVNEEWTVAQRKAVGLCHRLNAVAANPHFETELSPFGFVRVLTSSRVIVINRKGDVVLNYKRSRQQPQENFHVE